MDKVTMGTLSICGELGIDPNMLVELLQDNRELILSFRAVVEGVLTPKAFAQEVNTLGLI